jgi:transposase InsO family protein
MIHRCIAQLQEEGRNTALLCRVLGVSRSGYYAARLRAGQRPRICPTSTHLRAAFAASGRAMAAGVWAPLRAQGLQVGRYRVRTLMRINRLRPVWKRKFIHTTDSRHALPIADNVLNRHFAPATANAAWVSDITYIRTRSGWLYLAAVMDLFSRKIVGWAMAPTCLPNWCARPCRWPSPSANRPPA